MKLLAKINDTLAAQRYSAEPACTASSAEPYRDTAHRHSGLPAAICRSSVVTNEELAKTVDTSDEWIVQRTGIRERRIAATGEVTSDHRLARGPVALAHAKVDASNIDLIVVATATPDNTFPACAVTGAGRAWHPPPAWRSTCRRCARASCSD